MTTNCNIFKDKNFDIYCGRGRGAKNDPEKCKIGEAGWLGNPVAIGRKCPVCGSIHKDGGSTLDCYEKYLKEKLNNKDFKEAFLQLKGKKLGCFCKPKPCHTDVMIRILDEIS